MKYYKLILFILIVFLKTGNVLSDTNIFNVNNIEIEKKSKSNNDELANEAIKKGFHYQLFKQPTYTYSLRRLRKEGSLKMVRIVSTLGLKFIQGKDFADTDYGYVMKGGKYYEEDTSSFFKDTFGFLKKSSKNQILQFREILKTINEELGV